RRKARRERRPRRAHAGGRVPLVHRHDRGPEEVRRSAVGRRRRQRGVRRLSEMLTVLAAVILTNGKIWTGDSQRPWAEAVKIEGNRIVAVGTAAEIGRDGTVIDLKGRLAVPGFIDNHTHFISGGFELSSVQLRDAATPQEFARRIGEYAKKIGPGKWIV